jgi:hypothetical protein
VGLDVAAGVVGDEVVATIANKARQHDESVEQRPGKPQPFWTTTPNTSPGLIFGPKPMIYG